MENIIMGGINSILYPTSITWEEILKNNSNSIIFKNGSNIEIPNTNQILNFYKILKNETPYITNIKILNPNKVIQFIFSDKKIIKTICLEKDNFNFKFAFYLAYAKYFYNDILTPEGIENKAKEFMTIKFFNKLVEKGIKTYQKQEKEKAHKEAIEKEQKEIRKRHIEKKIRYKERKNKK